ncbi:DNA polymerase thumb domain-containing protein [Streptomyces sp. NPDC051561]|uniref:DNA polymerase Y family protein n=1 Tax=Streptomyces sp. NPDC051561 TaxID=3365658 RepID=UPI0037BA168A
MSEQTGREAPASTVLRVHFHFSGEGEVYERLLALLHEATPRVHALPPFAAELDVSGALRYHDTDAAGLAAMIQLRAAGLHGVSSSVGIAPTRSLALMAADRTAPGCITTVGPDPETVQEFLRPCKVGALPGVGPAVARTLARYGLHTIGALADASLLTVQRILGAATGRLLHERARGIDPRPVEPHEPARSLSASHACPRDELDALAHRNALLALAEGLGQRLRTTGDAAAALSLQVRYADRSTTTRSRALSVPSNHTPALTATAYEMYDRLGLQRARVRTLALRAESLQPADTVAHQLSLDPQDDRAHAAEAAADRVRARFGPAALTAASLAVPGRTTSPRDRAASRHPMRTQGPAGAGLSEAAHSVGPRTPRPETPLAHRSRDQ